MTRFTCQVVILYRTSYLLYYSTDNVQEADILKGIAAERPPIGIVGMGRHQRIFQRWRLGHLYHDGCMPEYLSVRKAELDEISGQELLQSGGNTHRSGRALTTGHELIKKCTPLHAGAF